jgi:PAS domain S-box-containing protein
MRRLLSIFGLQCLHPAAHLFLRPRSAGWVYHSPVTSPKSEFESRENQLPDAQQTANALREEELELRRIVNLAPEILAVTEPDGRISWANQAALDYFGITLADLGTVDLRSRFMHPEDAQRLVEERERAFAGSLPYESEQRLLRNDGTYRWFLVRYKPVKDAEGRVVRWYGGATDIEDRKRAEEAARRSEKELRDVFEAMPATVWRTTADGSVDFINHSWLEFTGLPGEEALGWNWESVVHPEDRARFVNQWRAALSTGQAMDTEVRVRRKDGQYCWWYVRNVPLHDDQGKVIKWYGTATNIHDLKCAEEGRRRSEFYLAEAQRITHTGSLAFNAAGNLYCSEELCRIWGFDPQQPPPDRETMLQRAHSQDRDRLREHALRAAHERKDYSQDVRIVLPDGTLRHVQVTGHPIFSPAGEFIEIVGTHVDVTERKRAEEERLAHVWFLEGMDRINRAVQGSNDLEKIMADVLDAALSIFRCDRAWLVYPCDPESATWRTVMERTRPEFPGAFALGVEFPMTPEVAHVHRLVWDATGTVRFGAGSNTPVPSDISEQFSVQSQILMAVYPKVDKPYIFGLDQCRYARVWTREEKQLFEAIGRRLTDTLTSLLMFRNLQESQAQLQEAQRIAHVGYWAREIQSGRLTWSDETYRIFGLRPQERPINLTELQPLIHPEDWELLTHAAEAAVSGGRRYNLEYRVIRPSGEVRFVHSQGDVTRDESGRPYRMFGTIQDITERKRSDAALLRSAEQLASQKAQLDELFEQAPEAIVLLDVADRVLRINPEFTKIFGYTRDEAIGRQINDLIAPEELRREADEYTYRITHGMPLNAETIRRRKDGKHIHISLMAVPISIPGGGQIAEYAIYRDITERRRAEEALRRSQAYLAEAQRLTQTGSWAWSPTTREPLYWSEEMFRIFSLDPQHGLPTSKAFWERVHPDDRDGMYEIMQKAAESKAEYAHDHKILLPEGTVKHVRAIGHPVLDSNGEVIEYVGTCVDITERKRAEEERERLEQLQTELTHINRVTTLGELAASIAHEIKQPITAAITNAKTGLRWLTRENPDLLEARDAIRRAVDDNTSAAKIIDRLRSFYTKSGPAPREPVDVNEVAHEMLILLRSEASRFAISTRMHLARDLPNTVADRVQLQQVFMNLMLNAIDAMKDGGGELTVRSELNDDSQLLISVSDSGVGLPTEKVDQIFSAFFTTKPEGTGMGLAITRSIIEAHGGRLWATANADRGATFHFTLPAESSPSLTTP